jgi:hypothetical protein
MAAFWQGEGQQRVEKRPSAGINMKLLSNNEGAIHGHHDEDQWACSTVEQGQAARPEAPA